MSEYGSRFLNACLRMIPACTELLYKVLFLKLLQLHGLQPLGHQVSQVTLVEQGHVGLTVNPIILKDPCHLVQDLLLHHHQSTCICSFHHWAPLQHEFPKKVGKKRIFLFTWFLFFTSPWSLKTLNRLCSNNSAFQEDRGVSQGFSVELARDRTWWGKGKSIVQDYLQ